MTRIEEVEQAYTKAVELVQASGDTFGARLPEVALDYTRLILGVTDRMLDQFPWHNLTATGAEIAEKHLS